LSAYLEMQSAIAADGGNVRKPKPAGVALWPQRAERGYRSEILQIIDAVHDDVVAMMVPQLDRLVREAGLRGDAVRTDVGDIGAFVDGIEGRITARLNNRHLRDLESRVTAYFNETSLEQRRQLIKQIRRAVAIDAVPPDGPIAVQLRLWLRENVKLIQSLAGSYVQEVSKLVLRGVAAGDRATVIADQLQQRWTVSRSKAKFIARDQISKLNGALTKQRQTGLGVKEYIWRTSRDERVRETHLQKEGRKFRWDRPPADTGHPGQDFQCVQGSTPLASEAHVVKGFRRLYAGPLSWLATDTGRMLTTTPNHPILTTRGLVSMADIEAGDFVLTRVLRRAKLLEHAPEGRRPTGDDIIGLMDQLGVVASMLETGNGFHGDAVAGSQVELYSPGFGMSLVDPATVDFILGAADRFPLRDCRCSRRMEMILAAMGCPPEERVTRLAKILSVDAGCRCHNGDTSLAVVPWLDDVADQLAAAGRTDEADALRRWLNRLAASVDAERPINAALYLSLAHGRTDGTPTLVELEAAASTLRPVGSGVVDERQSGGIYSAMRVDSVGTGEQFGGYVMNLETEAGWYLANGIVVGNCRCTAEPVIPGEPAREENRKAVVARVKAKRARLRKELAGKPSARLIARDRPGKSRTRVPAWE